MRVLTMLLLLFSGVAAQDELGSALSKLRAAGPGEREAVVKELLATSPTREQVIEALGKPVPVQPLEPGWHLREVVAEDGKKRPYQLYIPKSLKDETEPVPLLVHMHGGVSRPDFVREKGQVGAGTTFWPENAEAHKFVVAYPLGRADTTWWNDAGVAHVRAVIREAKRFAPIDDDAIVGTGFSDGGSGCFYFGMVAPDPFAAFMPMNGHPAVASGVSGKQIYLHNLARTPMFVAMTQDDQLYPAYSVLPHLAPLARRGAPMHMVSYPTGGHRPVYFKEQLGAFLRFLKDTPRDPLPMDLEWRCADSKLGRFRWVEVLEVGAVEGDAEATPDINVMSTPGRVRLGVHLDQNFAEAVRISKVVEPSVAATMGMQAGDIMLTLDDVATPNMQALRAALSRKKYGDLVKVSVRRGEEKLSLEGRFPAFKSQPIYRRDKPTARIAINVEEQTIHVTSRNVRRFKLNLAPLLFGEGPVTVRVNGKEAPAKTVPVSLERILQRYARDADAGNIFTREVVVDLSER